MSCFQIVLKLRYLILREPKLKYTLAKIYNKKYSMTIFYNACVSTLRYIIQNPSNNENQHPVTRKSVTNLTHYEDSTIHINHDKQTIRNIFNEKTSCRIPNSIQGMTNSEKQELLKGLIEESFMFIDLSDMLQGEDLEAYQAMIKEQIFTGEESILQNRIDLTQRLKYFDSQALHLLQIYIQFCRSLLQQLRTEQLSLQSQSELESFLPRLILQLKATLLTNYPESELINYSQLKKFIKQFNIMIEILISTISTKYQIHLSEDQFAESFFTKQNIKSLILYIVFSDQVFLNAVFQRFYNCVQEGVMRMTQDMQVDNQEFTQELRQSYFHPHDQMRKQDFCNPYKSNIQKLLQKQSKFPYFRKTLRTLQTITSPKQPIKVLKIIYQINKTISKEHTEFIASTLSTINENSRHSLNISAPNNLNDKAKNSNLSFLKPENNRFSMFDSNPHRQISTNYNKKLSNKYSFSRQIQCMIIKWLLASKKDKAKFIITNCLMSYFFVHENQLKDKKGSALLPFIQIIERYIQTNN